MNTLSINPALWVPISLVQAGRNVVLRRIRGGQGMAARLATLGLNPGMRVAVHQNHHRGPVVLGVKESRIMLGRGMADRIMVEEQQLQTEK